ncbi:hypothetical protein HPB51_013969 [Rhipicephalus microplus]|uniref:Exocyst complex component EXOC6/Sec15 N-terminal domain-containing protein n=1 Tax=Rhipicephalus microplus TaxID=6941 RepID=A0A9J6DA23_RHIMP|nr:hypothetical protein HPB51_013969 [Rhipicephalus microplus]
MADILIDSKNDLLNKKIEHHIYLAETLDAVVAIYPIVRAIYDGDEHERFLEKLDARINDHDREIEKMCNFHYQGFIDCIRELLHVRSKAQKLKMKERRYYPALKTIEQLEHTYLPRVSQHRFAQSMAVCIPKLRDRIKEASLSELKDFLENIRKHSGRIGEVALNQGCKQEQTLDEDMSAQDLVDFSPVYRCHHIYSVLGSRETFEAYYRQQRKHQARLALQPQMNMTDVLGVGFLECDDVGLVEGSYVMDVYLRGPVWMRFPAI